MTSNENKRERVKTVTPMEIKEPAGVKEIVEQNGVNQITIGWQNATEVAAEVWRQGNMALLDGDLMFAYKNTETASSGSLYQILVVKYFDWNTIPGTHEARKIYNGLYGYSLVTSGYSAMIPKVGSEYLEEIYKDLVAFKVNKQILTIFRNIIDNETSGN
jgi:hypothetical protein